MAQRLNSNYSHLPDVKCYAGHPFPGAANTMTVDAKPALPAPYYQQPSHVVLGAGQQLPWLSDWRGTGRPPLQTMTNNVLSSRTGLSQSGANGMPGVPDHAGFGYDGALAGTASFYSNYGVPIKGASSTDFNKGTMPKNFSQPLTCFYWYTYGRCNKTDEECLYTHHYTGVVAAAPIAVGGKGAFAGRNAIDQLGEHAQKATELREWEAKLAAKEMELNGKLISADASRRVGERRAEEIMEQVRETITHAETATDKARLVLDHSREELKAPTTESEAGALDAVDAAIEAVAALEDDFATLKKHDCGSNA